MTNPTKSSNEGDTDEDNGGGSIAVFVDKVGSYPNPSERYEYYKLPFCVPGGALQPLKTHTFAEQLGGYHLRPLGAPVGFKDQRVNCTTAPLTNAEVLAFQNAAENLWYYQWYVDDLPVWGMVGEVLPAPINPSGGSAHAQTVKSAYIYTSRRLTVHLNNNKVVKVDLTSDAHSLKQFQPGMEVTFTLDISLTSTLAIDYSTRHDRYIDHEFFRGDVHRLSIFNSLMLATFLAGMVALTIRKSHRVALERNIEVGNPLLEEAMQQDQEVLFQTPHYVTVMSALLGTGWQLVTAGVVFSILGVAGSVDPHIRGSVQKILVVSYFATFPVAGFVSGRFYQSHGTARGAIKCLALTASLLPAAMAITFGVLNVSSFMKLGTCIIPFSTLWMTFISWVLLAVPLCFIFGLLGFHCKPKLTPNNVGHASVSSLLKFMSSKKRDERCATWLILHPTILMTSAGFLEFGCINIELYYVCTSLWNYKYYDSFHFLFVGWILLLCTAAGASIATVVFRLRAGKEWQWFSFGCGFSIFFHALLYSVYFYISKTKMKGWFQAIAYFGTSLSMAVALGLSCGAVAHTSSATFARMLGQLAKTIRT